MLKINKECEYFIISLCFVETFCLKQEHQYAIASSMLVPHFFINIFLFVKLILWNVIFLSKLLLLAYLQDNQLMFMQG